MGLLCGSAVYALHNDLALFKSILLYADGDDESLKVQCVYYTNIFWYFTPDMIPLSLFGSELS